MIKLKIDNKIFSYFSTVNVSLKLNTIASTFTFSGFDRFFDILSYQKCKVLFGNETILTGVALNPANSFKKEPTLLSVSGYSKTGILEDCTFPPDLYPLQFDGLSLKDIALKVTNYFGLTLKVFDNAEDLASIPYEKVTANVDETIKSFLSKLCTQRGLILTHDNLGRLLIYKIEAKIAPFSNLLISDALEASFTPNAQGLHSNITVVRQAKKDNDNSQQVTKKSPFISGINRPLVKMLQDGEEIEEAANRIICAEARSFGLKLTFEGLALYRAGFYITLDGPILKKRTKFIIESVDFTVDKSQERTTINIVLPCVYTGILPSSNPFIQK